MIIHEHTSCQTSHQSCSPEAKQCIEQCTLSTIVTPRDGDQDFFVFQQLLKFFDFIAISFLAIQQHVSRQLQCRDSMFLVLETMMWGCTYLTD